MSCVVSRSESTLIWFKEEKQQQHGDRHNAQTKASGQAIIYIQFDSMVQWFNEGKKQKTKLCHKVFSALKNKEKSKTKMFGCLSEKMLLSDMKQETELGVVL